MGNPYRPRRRLRDMILADLKRKPVVSMADGTKIGEVIDLAIDTQAWVVRELVLEAKPGKGILKLGDVKHIGPDAVTVENGTFAAWNVKPNGLAFESLKDLTVVDGTGTVLGHAAELMYDADGTVHSFEVRQGGVFGIGAQVTTVTPADVRGVGEKLVTVDLPVAAPAVEPA